MVGLYRWYMRIREINMSSVVRLKAYALDPPPLCRCMHCSVPDPIMVPSYLLKCTAIYVPPWGNILRFMAKLVHCAFWVVHDTIPQYVGLRAKSCARRNP